MHARISVVSLGLLFLPVACVTGGTEQPLSADAQGAQDAAPAEAPEEAAQTADEPPLPTPPPAFTCAAGLRPGAAGRSNGLSTAGGFHFNLRTPPGYDPTVGAPLVAVFAPSGADRDSTEPYTGLTPPALARGFVIAYADHLTSEGPGADMLRTVVEQWCIDPARIYLTGHSDGGLITNRLAMRMSAPPALAAIAPSAAGTLVKDGDACPKQMPLSAMVMHSTGDQLFPGRGRKAADYYVRCMACDPSPGDALPNGCLPYGGCMAGGQVLYCQGSAPHGVWPGLDAAILDFFVAHPRQP